MLTQPTKDALSAIKSRDRAAFTRVAANWGVEPEEGEPADRAVLRAALELKKILDTEHNVRLFCAHILKEIAG